VDLWGGQKSHPVPLHSCRRRNLSPLSATAEEDMLVSHKVDTDDDFWAVQKKREVHDVHYILFD
jgi:hypothetical protein